MKQYKITSENISIQEDNDCVLPDNDPLHELKISNYLGGLGSSYRLEQYRLKNHFDRYPIKPESDGTDRPDNPYSEV
jgi:hypothetical protein